MVLVSGLAIVPFIPNLKSRVEQRFVDNNSPERKCILNNEIVITDDMSKCEKCITNIKNNINYDIRSEIINNEQVKDIHDNSEKFDERTEESFKYLQIFTAICDSFSHGANDVANAIGPYAAIVSIYMNDGDI